MENYNNNSSENGQDKTERQSTLKITTISVLTLDKKEMNDNRYGELQQ